MVNYSYTAYITVANKSQVEASTRLSDALRPTGR